MSIYDIVRHSNSEKISKIRLFSSLHGYSNTEILIGEILSVDSMFCIKLDNFIKGSSNSSEFVFVSTSFII